MKLIYTILSCLLVVGNIAGIQAQDLLYLKGKELPLKGIILDKSESSLGSAGRLTFIRENTKRGKVYKLDKIGVVLTKERKLFVDPANNSKPRDFSDYEYGIIFLSNGTSIAINSWEVVGTDGKIEYENHFTEEVAELGGDKFVAIYSANNDLNLFGDHTLAYNRLKNSFLPKVPKKEELELENKGAEAEILSIAEKLDRVEVKDDIEIDPVRTMEEKLEGPDMPVDMDEFNEKAKAKVAKFASYVKTILEGEDRMRIRSIIDQAMILFISDTCFIEVSSLNRESPIAYKIRRYFNRLNYLADQYTKIEITNGQVVKVSDIRKYKDTWYGTVTYGQRFSGYKDGILVYTDYTQKNINIVLKVYEPEIEGESKAIWDVLLSNISVTETSK